MDAIHSLVDARDGLLMDRLAWVDPDGWIDLATNQRVCPIEHDAADVSTPAWLMRCARLTELWCSHLVPLIDYAVLSARRIEVHACAPDAVAAEPRSGRCIEEGIEWLLQRRGLVGAGARRLRWVRDGARPRAMAAPWLGLCLEDLPGREVDVDMARRSRRRRLPAQARAIALDIAPRPALDAVGVVLESCGRGPVAVRVTAAPGAGLSTLLGAIAHTARVRGVIPVCPRALLRPGLAQRLRGRTIVCLADDRSPGTANAGAGDEVSTALVMALRQSIGVAAVVGRRVGPRDEPAIDLGRVPFEVLRRRVSLFPPPEARELEALVRASDGLPGRLVERWLSSAARTTFSHRRSIVSIGGLDRRWTTGTLQSSRVAEEVSTWGSSADSCIAETRISGFLRQGLFALDAARLDESEQWLRAAHCALGEVERPGEPLQHDVALALARCLIWQGRTDEAAAVLARVPAAWRQGAPVLRLIARIDHARGHRSRALALLAQAADACRTSAERAAVHADWARALAHAGDRVSASAHLREAVRAVWSARVRARLTSIRTVALEVLVLSRPARAAPLDALDERRVRRIAGSLLRRNVPLLIRLRVSRALETLGWRRARDVDAFIERWGPHALWPSHGRTTGTGESVMVSDLQAVLEICRDTDEPLAALERVCHCLRQRLHAAAVAIHGGRVEGRRLTLAGSARLSTAPLARRAIDSGAATAVAMGEAGAEGAAPIAYAAHTIGAIVCRWPLSAAVDSRDADALLAAAATAAAPHVQNLLDRERLRDDAVEGEPGFLGASPVMAALRERVRRAALAPFHVLIEGESGSGKEVVARALHATGPRRRRRFCALNCAALTDELIEAELFGHARGAFTGAVGERPGLFEDADGGTLFLDEVGELSPRAQAKLLRVIQDGEVRRVGENVSRRIDARLVAATNRPLREEAAAGRFRADLLYRLDVVRISVPPLRERPEDIVLLARTFWRDATERLASRATLHPGAVAALARYHWPGNVRELQNVVMALAVNAPARGTVTAARLPVAIAAQTDAGAALTLEAARRSFEERFVRSALARAGNQPGRAARDLGLTRQGLRKLLVRLRIEISAEGVDVRAGTP